MNKGKFLDQCVKFKKKEKDSHKYLENIVNLRKE